jgi:NTE family protein
VARIVGTSMGAVVGGLYASGISIDEIERVIGGLDPSKVALDQLNRLELPSRTAPISSRQPWVFRRRSMV